MMGHYDFSTVFASFLIAFLAGFVAFESVNHTRYSARPRLWISIGGITLGLGIWSMHFTGMLAWKPPFQLYYTIGRTLLSVVVAVVASWLALQLVALRLSRRPVSTKGLGALLVGIGICAMHYIGMSALHFDGPVMWHWGWVVASFVIAVTASWGAMELLARCGTEGNSLRWQLGASLIIGVAICGMHYAGMIAFMPAPGSRCMHLPWSFSGPTLARIGVGNALFIMVGMLVVSYRDKAVWLQMVSEARFEAQESARKLQGMAAAGKIAASVAHEINNPLSSVGNLLYLMKTGPLNHEQQKYLDMAETELRRIAAITTHTLRFYRQQSSPAPTSIPELFESALALFQSPLRAAGISVEKQWPAEVPQIVCLEGEIRQVVANLVSNAIDAMPQGGELQLKIDMLPHGLDISIRDTGHGISPEVRQKILEPFFTTKGRGGTGLGLSISAEIIARHGGTFSFTSSTDTEASGTCFQFFLPFAPSEGILRERSS